MEYILMDIEGTTTAIDFVHKTLFPFARKHLPEYLATHQAVPDVQACCAEAAETLKTETGRAPSQDEVLAGFIRWIDEDRKHPALKRLQGMIWETGYRDGHYQSHLYEDVKPAWDAWLAQGKRLGIYSSGSVQAQRLLFGHTAHGDLNAYLSNYFDTVVGHKREVASYQQIAKVLQLSADQILFLSDIAEELDAARQAGFQTTQLVRPGTKACANHPSAASFRELL